MARIVLGIGTSHSPQVTVPSEHWEVLRQKDANDGRFDYEGLQQRARPGLEAELQQPVWDEKYAATQSALRQVGEKLADAKPDVVVVFGDDQHEQFLDDNLPALSIYHGEAIPVVQREPRNRAPYKQVEMEQWARTEAAYPAQPDLACHLLASLTEQEFDLARTNRLREEVGIGHAFAFLYRRLWPGTRVPMVPVMVNTYFPPNQPTPRRCFALGQAVRRAVESWERDARVAVVASGGLSHIVMDEDLDRYVIDAFQTGNVAAIQAIPRARLTGGTSEILNWVTVAGCLDATPMTLVGYQAGYRSPAATGCGMAFAFWEPRD